MNEDNPMQQMLAGLLQSFGEKMPSPAEIAEMEKRLKRRMVIYKIIGTYMVMTSLVAHGYVAYLAYNYFF